MPLPDLDDNRTIEVLGHDVPMRYLMIAAAVFAGLLAFWIVTAIVGSGWTWVVLAVVAGWFVWRRAQRRSS